MRKFIIAIIIRVLSFIYRIANYIDHMSGEIIVNPGDVVINASIVWRMKMAPKGFVFYIAKLKLGKTLYTKNVAIYRKDLTMQQEIMFKWKAQRLFAESLTKQLKK